jgi:hypothetical protein
MSLCGTCRFFRNATALGSCRVFGASAGSLRRLFVTDSLFSHG